MVRRPAPTLTQRIAETLGVKTIVLASATENTAQEGQAFIGTAVHSTNVYLYVRPDNPGILTPSWGYQVRHKNPRTNANGFAIRQLPDYESGVTRVQIEFAQDEIVVEPALGFEIRTGLT